jgi:hypothetical protein
VRQLRRLTVQIYAYLFNTDTLNAKKMQTFSLQGFIQKFKGDARKVKQGIEREFPRVAGVETVNHYKKNFQYEGWEREKWGEVKRRKSNWKSKAKEPSML